MIHKLEGPQISQAKKKVSDLGISWSSTVNKLFGYVGCGFFSLVILTSVYHIETAGSNPLNFGQAVNNKPGVVTQHPADHQQAETDNFAKLEAEAKAKIKEAAKQRLAAQAKAKAQAEAIAAGNSLGVTLETFKNDFNEQSKLSQLDLSISNSLNLDSGGIEGAFKYVFNDHMQVIGSVNKKDGTIRDLVVVCQGGNELKPENLTANIGAFITATNSAVDAAQRDTILKRLGISKERDASNLNGSTAANGLKYSISSSSIGLMFSIANTNDVLK